MERELVMADMREYKRTILDAVKVEREADSLWSWRVVEVNKGKAKVRWSYFDYIEQKENIIITAGSDPTDEEGEGFVKVCIPGFWGTYVFVSTHSWGDVDTFEKAIRVAIRSAAVHCHNCY